MRTNREKQFPSSTIALCLWIALLTAGEQAFAQDLAKTASTPTVSAPESGDADFPQPSPSGRHNAKVTDVRTGDYDLVLIGDSITQS